MLTAKPRDRIVVFRLTQDEYNILKLASSERGSRSLSDFTRSELLAHIRGNSVRLNLDARFSTLEERLSSLKQDLEQLARLIRGVEPQDD